MISRGCLRYPTVAYFYPTWLPKNKARRLFLEAFLPDNKVRGLHGARRTATAVSVFFGTS